MYIFHHIALSVTDRDKSVAFYNQLGFREVYFWQAPDKSLTITHLKNTSCILELFCYADFQPAPETIHATATDLPIVGTKHFGLKVDSIEKALDDLIAEGLADKNTTVSEGRTGIRYFFIKDPDGILVEIAEDKRRLGSV